MPSYAFVISYADHNVDQYDHATGAYIRTLGQYNATWSPYYVTNFDSVTGLPLPFALGATDLQNPCSVTSDGVSAFLLDTMTCRIFRIQPDTGSIVATFGGRRGIGAGRITPDNERRSVIAMGNDTLWVIDNTGGYAVQYARTGSFLAEANFLDWQTFSGLAFTQCTGFAWDTARGHYWALVEGDTNAWLIRVSAAGAALLTGQIDLTARLGITGTFNGTPSGDVATRGLKYLNGSLYFWSGGALWKIDPTNTGGDSLVYQEPSGLTAPGWLAVDGTEIAFSLPNQVQGANAVLVLNPVTGSTRSYARTTIHPPSPAGQVSLPWDMSVVPYVEDAGRIARPVTAKANIRAVTARTLSARANIYGKSTQTGTARARITVNVQRPATAKAALDVGPAGGDRFFTAWQVEDQFGEFCRQFSGEAAAGTGLGAGAEVVIRAGYDQQRVMLMTGVIDQVSRKVAPDEVSYAVSGRDAGARELASIRLSHVWRSFPPGVLPTAFEIVNDACARIGLNVGVLEFPDYPLYNSYSAIGKTVMEIVTDLLEPWNQFKRIEHVLVIRDRVLSVKRIDWQNPADGGTALTRSYHLSQERQQVLYLDGPRLNEADLLYVRGAAYLKPRTASGVTLRTEYFKNTASVEAGASIAGQVSEAGDSVTSVASAANAQLVTTETEVIETVYGDKVLSRDEKTYINDELSSETKERMFYIEPGQGDQTIGQINASSDLIVYWSGTPSSNAMPWIVQTKRYGLADNSAGFPTFTEVFRQITQFYYDATGGVACEMTSTQEFDGDTHTWGITKLSQRIHSQTTGNSVRSSNLNFTFEDSHFKVASAAVQQVGGTRPTANLPNSRFGMIATQAQTPQAQVDARGNPIDPALDPAEVIAYQFQFPTGYDKSGNPVPPPQAHYTWSYQNPYLGQTDCDRLYQMALDERAFQLAGYKWETVPFDSILNPALHVYQPVSLEVEPGLFRSYWVAEVSHAFTAEGARSKGVARRLTLEELP